MFYGLYNKLVCISQIFYGIQELHHVGFGNVPIIGKLEMWDEHACCMTATAQCMVVYMMCCFWSAMKPGASNLECRMAQNWCHQFFFFLFSSSSSICQQKQHHHASLQICLQLIHTRRNQLICLYCSFPRSEIPTSVCFWWHGLVENLENLTDGETEHTPRMLPPNSFPCITTHALGGMQCEIVPNRTTGNNDGEIQT